MQKAHSTTALSHECHDEPGPCAKALRLTPPTAGATHTEHLPQSSAVIRFGTSCDASYAPWRGVAARLGPACGNTRTGGGRLRASAHRKKTAQT